MSQIDRWSQKVVSRREMVAWMREHIQDPREARYMHYIPDAEYAAYRENVEFDRAAEHEAWRQRAMKDAHERMLFRLAEHSRWQSNKDSQRRRGPKTKHPCSLCGQDTLDRQDICHECRAIFNEAVKDKLRPKETDRIPYIVKSLSGKINPRDEAHDEPKTALRSIVFQYADLRWDWRTLILNITGQAGRRLEYEEEETVRSIGDGSHDRWVYDLHESQAQAIEVLMQKIRYELYDHYKRGERMGRSIVMSLARGDDTVDRFNAVSPIEEKES